MKTQQNQMPSRTKEPQVPTIDLFDIMMDARRSRAEVAGRLMQRAFSGLFRRIAAPLIRLRRRQRTIRELLSLDERMLTDIGITRGDIPFVANGDWRNGNDNQPKAA